LRERITKGINKGLIAFGIVLFIIGLALYLYPQGYNIGGTYYVKDYPYQTLGIILVIAGIVFSVLALFYSPRKVNDLPPPPKST